MEDNKKLMAPIYNLPGVSSSTPLDMLEKILAVYSTYYILSEKGKKPLRPQLLKILAIYVLHGFSRESKMLAAEICNLKEHTRIDGLNKELRDAGYLVKDFRNDHKSYLNDDLKSLSEAFPKLISAIPKLKENGINSIDLNVKISLGFPL